MYRPSQRPSFHFRILPSPFARRFGIKSTPFGNEQYRNQQRKATEKRNRYQKVIICFASLFSLPIATQFLRCRGVLLWLVQNKHSTRSVYEASDAMLIFVIMRGQWMDGFFGEPSARAVNSPPPSYYKDSIEQVAPAITKRKQPKVCIT